MDCFCLLTLCFSLFLHSRAAQHCSSSRRSAGVRGVIGKKIKNKGQKLESKNERRAFGPLTLLVMSFPAGALLQGAVQVAFPDFWPDLETPASVRERETQHQLICLNRTLKDWFIQRFSHLCLTTSWFLRKEMTSASLPKLSPRASWVTVFMARPSRWAHRGVCWASGNDFHFPTSSSTS